MLAPAGGALLVLLVGLRHAFEPDHLTAVSTLVAEAAGARRGTLLGVLWLGTRDAARGSVHQHRHGAGEHAHAGPGEHLHLAGRTLALRPLLVGLAHGLAGSGAITALVVAELPDLPRRILHIALFGLGSILGMAAASGAVGASLRRAAGTAHRRRAFALASGALSIGLGIAWAIPELGAIA